MLKIAVILGSTRTGRVGGAVVKWVLDVANQRDDAELELVDIAAHKLPLDEAMPPAGDYHVAAVGTMLDQVVAWSNAMVPARIG